MFRNKHDGPLSICGGYACPPFQELLTYHTVYHGQ